MNIDVPINMLAVLLAALSTMIVGSIWYAPTTPTGKLWFRLTNQKAKTNDTFGPKQMAILFGSAFVLALFTAFGLASSIQVTNAYLGNSFLVDAVMTGFGVWAVFVAARMVNNDLFEGRRKKLTLVNISQEFVTFMVMALIIAAFGPAV